MRVGAWNQINKDYAINVEAATAVRDSSFRHLCAHKALVFSDRFRSDRLNPRWEPRGVKADRGAIPRTPVEPILVPPVCPDEDEIQKRNCSGDGGLGF